MNVEIYTADTPGTTLDAWGSPKGSGENLGPTATVAVQDRTPARYVSCGSRCCRDPRLRRFRPLRRPDRRGLGPWHPGLTARPTTSSSAARSPATAPRSTRSSPVTSTASTRSAGASAVPTRRTTPRNTR